MKKLIFILLSFSLFISCNKDLEKKIVASFPDGKPEQIDYYKPGSESKEVIKQEVYYPSGSLKYSLSIKDGKKNGLCTYFFENGKKWSEQYFVNDTSDGDHRLYYENGEMREFGKFEKGKCVGTWYFYDEKGNIIREAKYVNGEVIQ